MDVKEEVQALLDGNQFKELSNHIRNNNLNLSFVYIDGTSFGQQLYNYLKRNRYILKPYSDDIKDTLTLLINRNPDYLFANLKSNNINGDHEFSLLKECIRYGLSDISKEFIENNKESFNSVNIISDYLINSESYYNIKDILSLFNQKFSIYDFFDIMLNFPDEYNDIINTFYPQINLKKAKMENETIKSFFSGILEIDDINLRNTIFSSSLKLLENDLNSIHHITNDKKIIIIMSELLHSNISKDIVRDITFILHDHLGEDFNKIFNSKTYRNTLSHLGLLNYDSLDKEDKENIFYLSDKHFCNLFMYFLLISPHSKSDNKIDENALNNLSLLKGKLPDYFEQSFASFSQAMSELHLNIDSSKNSNAINIISYFNIQKNVKHNHEDKKIKL